MIDVEGVKITLKVGGADHILSNISEIIRDNFSVLFNDEFNGVYHYAKKSFV